MPGAGGGQAPAPIPQCVVGGWVPPRWPQACTAGAELARRGSWGGCSEGQWRHSGPLSLPRGSAPHHALRRLWGLCPTTTPHLCSPDPFSQPTSLQLLPQTRSAAPPAQTYFPWPCPLRARAGTCLDTPLLPISLGGDTAETPTSASWVVGNLPKDELGLLRSGSPTPSSEARRTSWAEHTALRAEPGDPRDGVRGSPLAPEKPRSLQRQAPAPLQSLLF